MVLVNGLTIDDINAALIALQRGQGEVVGGVKQTTVQNISISNSGGSGGPDFTPQINALQETAADLTERVETLEDKQTETEQTVDEIITRLNNAGIQRVIWQESNRTLYFYMSDRQLFVEIPAETVTLTLGNDNVLHFTMGEGENAFPQTIDLALPFIRTSEKGVAGGVASLDSNGRVPYSQLPESAMEYKGKWDASTNTPHLADGTGTNGDFYVCSAPGTVTFGTGNTITFAVNDRVIYDGTDDMWEKLPAGAVSSVNGQTGDVTLDANDIDYSSTKTVKQAIDDIQPVQADWEQSDSSAPDYIKNKIPIWIASGSASDNMTPVDSVTSGEMRPVTSNAVAQEGYLTSADITNQVTVDNMQSVSSSGVYNALNVATRVEPISGLFIYKIGRFCYFEMSKEVTGTSPIVFGTKLPQGYIPQGSSCRFTYINNGTDMPEGQLGFYTDGNIRLYKGGGGTINCTAKCNGMYLSTT